MKIMFIAGEASGDTLGAELARALRERCVTPPELFGAGGAKMAEAGVEIVLDLAPHAVVGIWEVLKNYGKFRGFFDQLLAVALARRPDVIVLIDYPGFNLRFARALKERARTLAGGWSPKIVFYVSPQIWAWHESRIHQIARDIDLLLSIFPFEKDWYADRKPDFRVEFIGHPLVDRYPGFTPAADGPGGVLLLPGSRERELRKHLPVMLPAARRLQQRHGVSVEMVLPGERLRDCAAEWTREFPEIEIRIGGLPEALARSRVAIASSGTVTMECAWFGVPTVVIYRTSWSTYLLGRRFIKVKFLAMPNLLAGQMVFPELIQKEASAENIAASAADLLNNPDRRNVLQKELRRVMASLGAPGASARAAEAVLSLDLPK
jgi:lipid-A-disaccharide synthase